MTPAQIKSAVLKKLQVTAADDVDAADDIAIITDKYTWLHAALLEEHLVTWSTTENVPAKAEQPIIMMLAAAAANEFSIPDPRYTRLIVEGGWRLPPPVGPSLAERQLRKAISEEYVSTPLVTEYY